MTMPLARLALLEATALAIAESIASSPPTPPEVSELTKKGRHFLAIVKAHFSDSHQRAMCKLGALLLDDPALERSTEEPKANARAAAQKAWPAMFDGDELTQGAALVPLASYSSHNYTVGEVSITTGIETICYCTDKMMVKGNHLGFQEGGWRPATVDEIKAAFAKVRALLISRDKA